MAMRAGDIVLTALQQSDGKIKRRPALLLKQMPPFQDWLVCGISTQLHHEVKGFDKLIEEDEDYFKETGLVKTSLIRLGFLAVVPDNQIVGTIGAIPASILENVLKTLSNFLYSSYDPKS